MCLLCAAHSDAGLGCGNPALNASYQKVPPPPLTPRGSQPVCQPQQVARLQHGGLIDHPPTVRECAKPHALVRLESLHQLACGGQRVGVGAERSLHRGDLRRVDDLLARKPQRCALARLLLQRLRVP